MALHPLGALDQKPEIQHYLLRKLNPVGAETVPLVPLLHAEMQRVLGCHFGISMEAMARPLSKLGPIPLTLKLRRCSERRVRADLKAAVEALFQGEFLDEVDRLTGTLGLPVDMAIDVFRNKYEINEDTLPLTESVVAYREYVRPAAPVVDEQGALEEFAVGAIYPRPHIQRYLLRKLNPIGWLTTPNTELLHEALAHVLELQVALGKDGLLRPLSQYGPLALWLRTRAIQSQVMNERVNSAIEAVYQREFNTEVDKLHYGLRYSKQKAIRIFRNRYEISEDLLPLDTSTKVYQRYEQEMMRHAKRGRPPRGSFLPVKESRKGEE